MFGKLVAIAEVLEPRAIGCTPVKKRETEHGETHYSHELGFERRPRRMLCRCEEDSVDLVLLKQD
jgi:hypothetical protein